MSAHEWTGARAQFVRCARCGVCRRADGKNKPCPGKTPPIKTRASRRLIGWRVRWEAVGALGEWTACKGGLNALPDACRVARNYRWAPCTRNVRVLRVYRRSKR